MIPRLKISLADVAMGFVAVLAGALVIYLGDTLLGVRLEFYYGVTTFSPLWVVDLFFVPFVAGVVVSCIYGMGGKILAHLSPLLVRIPSFYLLSNGEVIPPGAEVLPMGYWLLVVIMSVEFAAFGGVVGEILIKKTYGRTPKERLHKKYQKVKLPKDELASPSGVIDPKPGVVDK